MHDKPLVQVATAASCPSLLVVSEKNENVINCSTDFLQLWHYIQIYFFQCCNGAGKCISYRAIIIPRLAAHTQAPIMKLPCSKMNNLDFALTGPTSPRPAGLPETIWKSIIFMIHVYFQEKILNGPYIWLLQSWRMTLKVPYMRSISSEIKNKNKGRYWRCHQRKILKVPSV